MNISIGKGDVEESVRLYSPSGLLLQPKKKKLDFKNIIFFRISVNNIVRSVFDNI